MNAKTILKLALLIVAIPLTVPADKYWSGAGTWDTNASIWGASSGVYSGEKWVSGDDAFIEGTAGVVTLTDNISIGTLSITDAYNTNRYTIEGGTLIFSGGTITVSRAGGSLDTFYGTFKCAITGAPTIDLDLQQDRCWIQFSPTNGSMVLGSKISSNGSIELGGSTTGNILAGASGKTKWTGTPTSEWTLTGLASGYSHKIYSGNVIISSGTIRNSSRDLALSSGATLHYNNPGAVDDATGSTGVQHDFTFSGGNLDNSSGVAITTSTYNPDMTFAANWTFIGGNGSDSDLHLGNGGVLLTADRQVTISHPETTLTLGGSISGPHSFTKAGSGTLRLTGANTYSGDTYVSAGTLSISNSAALSDASTLYISEGTIVDLQAGVNDTINALYIDGQHAAAGTWGSRTSSATYEWDEYFSGDGRLTVLTGGTFIPIPPGTVITLQ